MHDLGSTAGVWYLQKGRVASSIFHCCFSVFSFGTTAVGSDPRSPCSARCERQSDAVSHPGSGSTWSSATWAWSHQQFHVQYGHFAFARGRAAVQPDTVSYRTEALLLSPHCRDLLTSCSVPLSTHKQASATALAANGMQAGRSELSNASAHDASLCEAAQTRHQLGAPWSRRIACSRAMHVCGSPEAMQLTAGPC